MTRTFTIIAVAIVSLACAWEATAQNDWQFPDPYFGILEIEKSHPPAVERRPRVTIAPAPRPSAQRPRLLRPRRRHVLPTPRP